jgi:MoaA/NifB/PqqE/SkfB family radical SAM enzyme
MQDSSGYCPRIHHGLSLSAISNERMSYSACCWTAFPDMINDDLDWNHPHLEDLRRLNRENILPADRCRACLLMEQSGQQSMRQGYEIQHGSHTYDSRLMYLDVNIDYTCNLACVTCGPAVSTTWRKELKIKNLSVRPQVDRFIDQLSSLDLTHIREVRFWGGEPFLTLTHQKILNYFLERADPSQIKLYYNTNGTCRIDPQLRTLLEKFKFVRICFSIDAVDDRFGYIRYPAEWPQVRKNLEWWRTNLPHNAMLAFTVTASVFNVLYLDEVWRWQQENFSRSCYGDDIEIYPHLAFGIAALENMPGRMADHLRDMPNYCQPWIQNLPHLAGNADGPEKFRNYVRELDLRRGLRLDTVLPELAEFIDYL